MLTASIMIYSGRPNPRWVIAGEAEQRLLAELDGLPVASEGRDGPAGLGYAGIELVRGNRAGGDQVWTIGEGRVSDGKRCFADAGRRLERMLLAMARARLGDQIPANIV